MSKKKKPLVLEAQQALEKLQEEIVKDLSPQPKALREQFRDRARKLVDDAEKLPSPER
jgi:hypothetical protein